MNPLEIILIIIGVIIIAISCKLVDRSVKTQNHPTGKSLPLDHSITEEDKKQLMNKMNELLSEVGEETIIRTDDALSKLSNEKIMAVSEFSDQILEKINRNHEEVVFLYSMLNDKQRELKAALVEIDSSKKKVQEIMESKVENDKMQAAKNSKNQTSTKAVTQATQADKSMKANNRSIDVAQELPILSNLSSNNNSEILALYSQGRTVIEISKLLGLGQGEVKLVIDLFKGKK